MPDDKSTLLDVSTKAPAPDPVRNQEAGLHHIRIVGGGAAGIELVTRLGDTLGQHGRARITLIEKGRTHLWKPLLHAIAAGSMDPGGHELNYLAQAHWHHFRYRFGEMIGLDRTKKEVGIAATHDEEGRTGPCRRPHGRLLYCLSRLRAVPLGVVKPCRQRPHTARW
jgi:NADH:quinone reductase (non-electrogenic)